MVRPGRRGSAGPHGVEDAQVSAGEPFARGLFVRELGVGERVVLVHGSVFDGAVTWARQLSLAERFRLVIPDRRGYGLSPDADREDFEVDAIDIAELLGEGAHLVGHSYGGLIALLAAARRPAAVRSLVVVEPPAFAVARGDPAVEAFLEQARGWAERVPSSSPEEMLAAFLTLVGVDPSRLPKPLSPSLIRGARMLANERPPDEAVIPFESLSAASFPKLVVSGAHSAALDAVCDVLERRLPAERVVIPGRGHAVQTIGEPFNERIATFMLGAR